ncbi:MAG TPA: murein biosynthesis integral membrane protein MurJ [Thermodesulfobacteriota bacterium]|nr:murein biosynthesis integral membrane protein MurJ [Thermodesulfobacteriota bacterium]
MRQEEEITRAAGIVGSLTLLSRILGLVRDMVIAYFFGARAETDAFYVAYRIPNLLRRFLAEGSLTISFIPVFTEYLENRSKEEAKRVSDITFTLLFITLILVSVLGILLSPLIIKLFASGFKGEIFKLAVNLNQIMFPYIFFVSLAALAMGVLNSLKHFFAPAFSPVVFNIVNISAVFLLYQYFDVPIFTLAIGVIAGGALQFLIQFPFLKNRDFLFSFRKNLRHPAVKRIALLMSPQLFGLAVYNFNILVSTQYASHLPGGTVSYLWYSERLIEFPLGIFAVSIATALLPSLSSQASKGEYEKFGESYSFALRLMLFVMIPALVGLIALRVPICNVLYQRGEFTFEETLLTSQALLGYAIGLWAVGGIRITAPGFYAIQDTKTPVKVALLAFIINAALGYILGFTLDLKHTGLALASSISSISNFFILFLLLTKRMKEIEIKRTLVYVLKVLAASLLMGATAWEISAFSDWSQSGFSLEKISIFCASIAGAVIVYFVLAKLLKIEEVNFLFKLIRRKAGRG